MTEWIDPQPIDVSALQAVHASPLLKGILLRRGILDEARAAAFLHPENLPPIAFPGVERLTDRLLKAADDGEPICVWGDFDADGQTSTAVLIDTLRSIGATAHFHVPNRTEGHGVQISGLRNLLEKGIRVILTCDTGTTAHEAVAWANQHGMQVLITDHHDFDTELPAAHAILNPKSLAASHPLADLAGVGVAFKLAEALLSARGGDPSSLLDLVALGLIADVALLRAETRSLARRGIARLRMTHRLGLLKIAELADVVLRDATEESIGFALAPRLNSLGRLGDAALAVELLLTEDPDRASILAMQIEDLNTQRRLLAEQVYQAAEERLLAEPALARQPLILLEHTKWPGGVLGIVASRLAGKHRKPVILLSMADDQTWRGSCRSIEGLHITRAIAEHRHLLLHFGGHPMAAGLSLEAGSLPGFRRGILASVERLLGAGHVKEAPLHIDQLIALPDASPDLAEELEQLAPFGPGNPPPVLVTTDLHVVSSARLGRSGEHRRLTVTDGSDRRADVLWWNAGEAELPSGPLDLAYTLRQSAFQGQRLATLTLIDFRRHETTTLGAQSIPIQVLDFRHEAPPPPPLDALIWAEDAAKPRGADRLSLAPASTFIIWTIPPGPAELQAALRIVRPQAIWIVGKQAQLPAELHEFLGRLVGLLKFAARRRAGHARVSQLAAACAQRELAIRLGLEWLTASGHLHAAIHGDEVVLGDSARSGDQVIRAQLLAALKIVLSETAAYRRYFENAPLQILVKQFGGQDDATPSPA